MGTTVGLNVEALDVDDSHDLDLGWQQIGGRADDVRNLEGLGAGELVGLDCTVGGDLAVAGIFD